MQKELSSWLIQKSFYQTCNVSIFSLLTEKFHLKQKSEQVVYYLYLGLPSL